MIISSTRLLAVGAVFCCPAFISNHPAAATSDASLLNLIAVPVSHGWHCGKLLYSNQSAISLVIIGVDCSWPRRREFLGTCSGKRLNGLLNELL